MSSEYGVLGHNLSHTMSPFIHTELFGYSGIGVSYKVEDTCLSDFEKDRRLLLKYDGLNVTIPHKKAVMPLMDKLDESAVRADAVNCIKNTDGILTGFSTDGYGFMKALELNGIPVPEKVMILGCGGAAGTVAHELSKYCREITLVCRPGSLSKAEKAACGINSENCRVRAVTYGDTDGEYGLLVNATPVGMYPDVLSLPTDSAVIENCGAVFDLVYNPHETKLLKAAKECGIPCAGGMAMLVYQAAMAHYIWYGGKFSDEFLRGLIERTEHEVIKSL